MAADKRLYLILLPATGFSLAGIFITTALVAVPGGEESAPNGVRRLNTIFERSIAC